MRYFKENNYIFEVTDDLLEYRCIYDLETREHLKGYWWDAHQVVWKNLIELTKNDLFIELL